MLVAATGGGVAFVLANRPQPVHPPTATPTTAIVAPPTSVEPADCPTCRTGSAGEVTDVTDLSRRFASKSEGRGEFVSFDEPPLARSKGDVVPVEVREVLPPPREVK
jgi:hypothetical protein